MGLTFAFKTDILYIDSTNGDVLMSNMPELFQDLIRQGCLAESNIFTTEDGFYAANHRLVQLGGGYLYAVPSGDGYVYGVFTIADQDALNPGVVISFVPLDETRMQLTGEASNIIKAYFRRPQAQGGYLIARIYVDNIIAAGQSRHIALPRYFETLYRQNKGRRISRFVEINNEDAVHTVCDQETIYIRDLENISDFEKLAILATHTGCTSFHSFAAGVRYFARPFAKESGARLTLGEELQPYHDADGKWVKKQKKYH